MGRAGSPFFVAVLTRRAGLLFLFGLVIFLRGNAQAPAYYDVDTRGRVSLNEAGATHFARLALSCIQQEYPNKLNQTLTDSSELHAPSALHPAFYGCYDWHSSVHGHWMLVRLLKEFPQLPLADTIRQRLDENLRPAHILREVIYFETASPSWERTYGWAWLLKLAEELHGWEDPDARRWQRALDPLTRVVVQRYLDFLPVQQYPVRTGVHPNTAFGLAFAWDYANATGREEFKALIEVTALRYYLYDQNCPTDWEPSGEDFLSPCLQEADLMRRVLNRKDYNLWVDDFFPPDKIKPLIDPAEVADRSDPKIVHLDGLNLSRAWCMYGITPYLNKRRYRRWMNRAAQRHLTATVPNVATEHYEGSHWLASFAVYALLLEH